MNVFVTRSPLRLLVYALVAVPAILLAVDMTISYRFIRHPETFDAVVGQTTDESGQLVDVTEARLTDTGKAERRRDLLLGTGLFIGGAFALGWSMRQLIRPSGFLAADDDGLHMRIDGMRHPARFVSWDAVAEVRSGVIDDDGVETPVLSIRFRDGDSLPERASGGVVEPPWLHLFAEEWEVPAHQVAAMLEPDVMRSDSDPA